MAKFIKMNRHEDMLYWTSRYKNGLTGWDVGYPTTPLKQYIDQLKEKNAVILIPGAGNAYEAEYLVQKGFTNVHIMDISEVPLNEFQKRNPNFPAEHVLHEDFFRHQGQYDLILEQTFFCSFVPSEDNRYAYAKKMASLLKSKGRLVGVWFDIPLTEDMEKRPFGGDKESYLRYLDPFFETITFERCYNSIPARHGNELFGIFEKNNTPLTTL